MAKSYYQAELLEEVGLDRTNSQEASITYQTLTHRRKGKEDSQEKLGAVILRMN